ncbi:unnamed protein product [Ixodes pacificus]
MRAGQLSGRRGVKGGSGACKCLVPPLSFLCVCNCVPALSGGGIPLSLSFWPADVVCEQIVVSGDRAREPISKVFTCLLVFVPFPKLKRRRSLCFSYRYRVG